MAEDNLIKALSDLAKEAVKDGSCKRKDICIALGMQPNNWNRVEEGKALINLSRLIKFYEVTQLEAVKDFLASRFNIDFANYTPSKLNHASSPADPEPIILPIITSPHDEISALKAEIEALRKKNEEQEQTLRLDRFYRERLAEPSDKGAIQKIESLQKKLEIAKEVITSLSTSLATLISL
jgi:hypothetical protein